MRGAFVIHSSNDRGIYYACVSLCQLLDRGESGEVIVPAVKIADWPEIGLRLAKTSALFDPLPDLTALPIGCLFNKISVMGLQFHGGNSEPGVFTENVKAICWRTREEGILRRLSISALSAAPITTSTCCRSTEVLRSFCNGFSNRGQAAWKSTTTTGRAKPTRRRDQLGLRGGG